MALPKSVVITIESDGEVVIEANNFQGVGCKKATADLEMVLASGGAEKSDTKKPDFWQSDTGRTTTTR